MNYKQSVSYIHSLLRFGVSPGLERISALLDKLGNPQNDLKFIHVAGTNGKGSVCNLCSNILIDSGYSVGLFTSPFVTDFCERIQINSKMIKHDELALIVQKVKPIVEELSLNGIQSTEFEVITAIAMLYFKQKNCDFVVLETGLGGRFDATNIINSPLVTIITCISMDHVKILGNSIDKIAFEKCGIIKENGTTICYPSQPPKALTVIKNSTVQKNNDLVFGCLNDIEVLERKITHTNIKWNKLEIKLKLVGEHQVINTSTAISTMLTIRNMGYDISDKNIKSGIENTSIPARFEVLSENPLIILDGAHNADGIDSFVSSIEKLLPDRKKLFVLGTMSDKDYKFAIERVARASTEFVATTPSNPRSMFSCNVCEIAKHFCNKTVAIESPYDAINYALHKSKLNGYALIICGSLFLASDIRSTILKKSPLLQE